MEDWRERAVRISAQGDCMKVTGGGRVKVGGIWRVGMKSGCEDDVKYQKERGP